VNAPRTGDRRDVDIELAYQRSRALFAGKAGDLQKEGALRLWQLCRNYRVRRRLPVGAHADKATIVVVWPPPQHNRLTTSQGQLVPFTRLDTPQPNLARSVAGDTRLTRGAD
jgi:hypothetical protein